MYDHEQGLKNWHAYAGSRKKKHVPVKRRPSSKKVEVYTSVNNAWKLSNAATVVEAL